MRTQDEIVECIEASAKSALVPFLDYERAKPWLGGIPPEEWTRQNQDSKTILATAERYMHEYGWLKVLAHSDTGAMQTIDLMWAWIWLLGEDNVLASFERFGYRNYGAPKLKFLCECYGWPIPDDPNIASMAVGNPCRACRDGAMLGCRR